MSAVEITRMHHRRDRAPRVAALVDDVKVAWRIREARYDMPALVGWVCSTHGPGACEHTAQVEAELPSRLVSRMHQRERAA